MRIRLDEVDFTPPEGTGDGKKSIFEAVKREAASKNRVVSQIIVDGKSLAEHDEFCILAGVADVRFVTQPIRELLSESIAEGKQYIPILKKGLESIATDFEEKRVDEALTKFSQAIEGINWLVGVFDRSCILLGIPTDTLVSGSFEDDFGIMRTALEDMTTAMENGKTMTLAYLIREKLLPAIDRFSLYWFEVSSQLDAPLQ